MKEQSRKTGFIVYDDYEEHISLLSDTEAGVLFKALLCYGRTGEKPELDGMTKMAFSFISAQMDRDAEKYEAKRAARSAAGRQGGRPKKEDGGSAEQTEAGETAKPNESKEKQKKQMLFEESKKSYTDTVTVTDTVTDITPSPLQGDEPATVEKITEEYHSRCKSYAALAGVNRARRRKITACIARHPDMGLYRSLFDRAEASAYLRGDNPHGWRADFDWLISHAERVVEGVYSAAENTRAAPSYSNLELERLGLIVPTVPA